MKKILLIDDEPYHLKWLAENLTDFGYEVEFKRSVGEAIAAISTHRYRLLLVDLNIPVSGAHEITAENSGAIYKAFPGLLVASQARNLGYRGRQVALYSAHKEPAVAEAASALGIEYIVKQDSRRVMREIEDVLSFDPTSDSI